MAQILIDRGDWPKERFERSGVRFPIVAVSDPLKNSCYDSDELHVPDLLASVRKSDNADAVYFTPQGRECIVNALPITGELFATNN